MFETGVKLGTEAINFLNSSKLFSIGMVTSDMPRYKRAHLRP